MRHAIGVPEFWCDRVLYREMAGPGVLRIAFGAGERGRVATRAKILMPVRVMLIEQPITAAFLRCRAVQENGPAGAVLM